MKTHTFGMTAGITVALVILCTVMPVRSGTVYVTPDGTGTGTPFWANATSLTNALAIAGASDQLWLAEGTYTNDATFTVPADRALYGGFTNGMATFAERDWEAHPAILDGQAQNRRVVTVTAGAATTVLLDGLVVTNGGSGASLGGGILKTGAGHLILANCRIVNNRGTGGGGRFEGGTILMTNSVVANNDGTTGSHGVHGYGIYVTASGITLDIVDCVFSGQYAANNWNSRDGFGAGLRFDGSVLRVLRTEFINNRAASSTRGGAVYIHGNATTAVFSNCVFRGNSVNYGRGGAMNIAAGANTVNLINCTFASNRNMTASSSYGGAINLQSGTVNLKNCILWTNWVAGGVSTGHEISTEAGTVNASYSLLTGMAVPHVFVASGSVNLSSVGTNDPLFASAADLHVSSPAGRWENGAYVTTNTVYSPAIDAGDPADPVGAEPSENGGRINLGAYGGTAQASKSPAPVAPQVANRSVLTNDYTRMILRGELTNSAPVIASVWICYGTTEIAAETTNGWDTVHGFYPPQQTGTVFSVRTSYLVTNTTYYYRAFASNTTGTSWAPVGSFVTATEYPPLWGVGGGTDVIHVKSGAVGEADGRDWFNAYPTVVAGVAAVGGTRTNIWIAGATYQESSTLTLGASMTMLGGFAGTETNSVDRDPITNPTLLDGQALARRIVSVTAGAATTVLLDGLVITNSGGGGLSKTGVGHLILSDCRIVNNTGVAYGGGCTFESGTVLMTNCVVDKNFSATYGARGIGIYALNVALELVDSVVSGQDHTDAARDGRGGGLYYNAGANQNKLRVWRTEFIGNRYSSGGAVYLDNHASTDAVFSNSVFRANLAAGQNTYPGAAVRAFLASSVTSRFVNCTFAYNTNSASHGGSFFVGSGTVDLKNCILWTNRVTAVGTTGHEIRVDGGAVRANFSLLTGTDLPYISVISGSVTLGDGIRTANPLFASASDLHLQSPAGRWDPAFGDFVETDTVFSPAIDAGDPTDPIGDEPTDNGNIRINMGYYGGTAQASKSPPPAPPQLADRGAETIGHRGRVSGELTNDASVSAEVYLCYGESAVVEDTTNGWNTVAFLGEKTDGDGVFSTFTTALQPLTTYHYRLFATNIYGGDWTVTDSFLTGLVPPGGGADVIHVNPNADWAQDGTDWTNAYRTISAGIAAVSGSRTNIWITGSVYTEGVLLIVAQPSKLIGGFEGFESSTSERALTNAEGVVTNYTVLDGNNSHACMSITATSGGVWLDTLTISNAPNGGALQKSNAGMLVVNNCRIVNNRVTSNGQLGIGCRFTGGAILMTNSVVADNRAQNYGQSGFGIYSVGATLLEMVDCVVSNNHSDGYGNGGTARHSKGAGLFFNTGELRATRTYFVDNYGGGSTLVGGSAVYLGNNATMSATFRNCVFRNNTLPYYTDGNNGLGGAIWADLNSIGKTVTVQNCTFGYNLNDSGGGYGGAVHISKGTLLVKNSIFWTNSVRDGISGSEIYADSADSHVVIDYSLLTGTNAPHVVTANGATVEWGVGILADDPLFASTADVHLQSKAGRWDPALAQWVNDSVNSPAIDAGNPADPVGDEPHWNGRRINLGVYGGTWQASKTPMSSTLFMMR